MSNYLKSIVAAVGVVVMTVYVAAQDKAISFDEANGIVLAVVGVLTAAGVYSVRNTPSG